jgi:hypothetical protein
VAETEVLVGRNRTVVRRDKSDVRTTESLDTGMSGG